MFPSRIREAPWPRIQTSVLLLLTLVPQSSRSLLSPFLDYSPDPSFLLLFFLLLPLLSCPLALPPLPSPSSTPPSLPFFLLLFSINIINYDVLNIIKSIESNVRHLRTRHSDCEIQGSGRLLPTCQQCLTQLIALPLACRPHLLDFSSHLMGLFFSDSFSGFS